MPLLDTSYCKNLLGMLISDLVLQILSFSAHTERENMLQKQAEGIAAARARGVKFGRRPVALPGDFDRLCEEWREGKLTGSEVALICGVSLKTLYNKVGTKRKT